MASSYSLSISKSAANVTNFRRNSPSLTDFITYIRSYCTKQPSTRKKKMTEDEVKEAQEALLDYLVMTRRFRYADAENMSYNANFFLETLLDKVEFKDSKVGRSVTRFLSFNPINEFEPFFESLGLHPLGVSRLLPRNLTFLADDQSLLQNYYTLCDFGIPRNKIGKIYENSRELFYCDANTLASKLHSFSKLGFSRLFFPLLLARTSQILSDKTLSDLEQSSCILKSCGIEIDWIEINLEECRIFKWSTVLGVLTFFISNGYTKEQLGLLIKEHPYILFYDSGHTTFSLITFLFKFGSQCSQISSLFLRFPEVHVSVFFYNLRRFFKVFDDIRMDEEAIGNLFRTHTKMLGCCKIRSGRTLKTKLRTNRIGLCKTIEEDPEILKTWANGYTVKPIYSKESKFKREKFLLDNGLAKDSTEMEKLSRRYYGKGSELQKRFDFLVNAGISREDVISMVKIYPQILSNRIDVLQEKIDIVEEFGYPLSKLAEFPSCFSCSVERIRLRLSMYEFIRNANGRKHEVPTSIIFGYTEQQFVQTFVRNLPNGMEVWHQLKKNIYGCH